MCGIIWALRKDNKSAKRLVRKRFDAQRTRGTQGFGLIEIDTGQFKNWYRTEREDVMHKQLNETSASEILFHHRMPTSTPNVAEATHPIVVRHASLQFDYYVVHNGIISNADKLRNEHEELGFAYTTTVQKCLVTREKTYMGDEQFNDSEALAIDLALAIEGNKSKLESEGSIAFMVLQVDKTTQKVVNLFFGRNTRNPLVITDEREYVTIASQGTGTDVKPHTLMRWNYETGAVEEVRELKIDMLTSWYDRQNTNKSEMGYATSWRPGYVWDDAKGVYTPPKQGTLPVYNKDEIEERTRAFYEGERERRQSERADAPDDGLYVCAIKEADGTVVRFKSVFEFMDAYDRAEDDLIEAEADVEAARAKKDTENIVYWENWVTDLSKTLESYAQAYAALQETHYDEIQDYNITSGLEQSLKDF